MKHTVLLIDDDAELVDLLRDYLNQEGFAVLTAGDGTSGLASLSTGVDIVVLDVMMPGISGIETLARIRTGSNVPVLMLTARGDDTDRIAGLELGADDYVAKPCTPRELTARIRAILKRVGMAALPQAKPLTIGDLTVWPAQRRAECGGRTIDLTSTEFSLVELLARKAGQPVSKSELSQEALGRTLTPFDRSIDVHMSSIRQKIGKRPDGRSAIQTVIRKGYQLIVDLMGRLFWKFFFIFWLAQIVASTGVGVMVWLEHRANGEPMRPFVGAPPPPPGGAYDPGAPRGEGEMRPPPKHIAPPLLPILAGSLVSLVFAALLAWYFARPIRTLRAAFAAVADGKLETRIGGAMGKRNDELADLGHDFDHMASRLDKLIETQRRLLHDVSHELRSPLARLQAAADLMVQQPERGGEFVGRIQRDTARMDGLVGELLTLARLDAGMAGRLDEDVDIYEIVVDVADAAGFEAQIKHCTIDCTLAESIVVRGNHELLHRAIENVVRNALRHSPENGVVTISVEIKDARLALTVSDQGPGVAPADLGAIFEPFVRGSNAPSSTGHGLGLAITRRVALAHGGGVRAENRTRGGLAVTIEVPLAPLAPFPAR